MHYQLNKLIVVVLFLSFWVDHKNVSNKFLFEETFFKFFGLRVFLYFNAFVSSVFSIYLFDLDFIPE